jgi:hypothetical protein
MNIRLASLGILTCPPIEKRKYRFTTDQLDRTSMVGVLFRIAHLISQRRTEPTDAADLSSLFLDLDGTFPRCQIERSLAELAEERLIHFRVEPHQVLVSLGPCPHPERRELLMAIDVLFAASEVPVPADSTRRGPKNAALISSVHQHLGDHISIDAVLSAIRAVERDGEVETFESGGQRYVRLTQRPEPTNGSGQ